MKRVKEEFRSVDEVTEKKSLSNAFFVTHTAISAVWLTLCVISSVKSVRNGLDLGTDLFIFLLWFVISIALTFVLYNIYVLVAKFVHSMRKTKDAPPFKKNSVDHILDISFFLSLGSWSILVLTLLALSSSITDNRIDVLEDNGYSNVAVFSSDKYTVPTGSEPLSKGSGTNFYAEKDSKSYLVVINQKEQELYINKEVPVEELQKSSKKLDLKGQ